MRFRTRSVVAALIATTVAAVLALIVAAPGTAACALVEFSGFEAVSDGVFADRDSSPQQRRQIAELLSAARSRITQTFGAPRAEPLVVFYDAADGIGPFRLNGYGSAEFFGDRACVLVGPKGRNVDVIAHELMHAELFERVGYWRRFREVPIWFDEGVAMQVDHRAQYDFSDPSSVEVSQVRQLESVRQFVAGDEQQLTWNYAAAKREVVQWLAQVGERNLYRRLDRIGAGEAFNEATAP
ncbi:MAG: hypothetical protein V4812_07250 [Pseudomonadota bacterium]